MDTTNLEELEQSTVAIIDAYQRLQSENRRLKSIQKQLLVKNQLASNKIKKMIGKLKTIERQP